jgi:hypothetical protein
MEISEGDACESLLCGNYFREHNTQFWERLDDSVKRQGWFYLVLAEEA